MISVEEALDRLFALVPRPKVENVSLTEAAGCVLLDSVSATRCQPPFAASAMDGYAIRGAEAVPGASFRIVGEAAAGRRLSRSVGPGEAARILTGAPLPEGADSVVIQEEVSVEGDCIVLSASAVAAHVRPAGNDFAVGASLRAPRRLSPTDIALLAAFGRAEVPVACRPEVAILSTGDELVMPGDLPSSDQIFAANAFGLHAMLAREGARPRILPIAPDHPSGLAAAFELAKDADVILTVGGASVGDHDLVAPAARGAGAELAFHMVAMRPGKPLLAGRMPNGAILLGLPGNPVSALVCGVVFLLPVIRCIQGLPAAPAPRHLAPLAAALPPNGPREHYLRAWRGPDGLVHPHDRQDSSLLTVVAESNCLLIQRANDPGAAEGQLAEVLDF